MYTVHVNSFYSFQGLIYELKHLCECVISGFTFTSLFTNKEQVDVNPDNTQTKSALNILIFNLSALQEHVLMQGGISIITTQSQ